MSHPSPMLSEHKSLGATTLAYGPAESAVEVVESYGELDFEYAALRKGCVLLDLPHRSVIEATGEDRVPFLNSMLTQELKGFGKGRAARAFWLNRKGRVVSDLTLMEDDAAEGVPEDGRLLIELDTLGVEPTLESLNEYIITEDVELSDATQRWHALGLHGPTAPLLVGLASGGEGPVEMGEGGARTVAIAGVQVRVMRHDDAGEPGFTLLCPADGVVDGVKAVWDRLVEMGEPFKPGQERNIHDLDQSTTQGRVRLRRAGWAAFNVARIEAGTPVFRVDFTTESLPAETGLLDKRVSFTKGCYLGQEVVARMKSLGHPKQLLVAYKLRGERSKDADGHPRQAVGGSPVVAAGEDGSPENGPIVGQVTSSTISPMLGATAIGFAQIKYKHANPDAALWVDAEGAPVEAAVQDGLRFVTPNAVG